jgi:hypothetical protein
LRRRPAAAAAIEFPFAGIEYARRFIRQCEQFSQLGCLLARAHDTGQEFTQFFVGKFQSPLFGDCF